MRFRLPLIANSSKAMTGRPPALSQGRVALEKQAAAQRSYTLMPTITLTCIPSIEIAIPSAGDPLFANTPLFLLSQGSSYNDKPFMEALASIPADFAPKRGRFWTAAA